MYACEAWASTKADEGKIAIFEKKILRRIYGPVFSVDLGVFERLTNRTFANYLAAKDWNGLGTCGVQKDVL